MIFIEKKIDNESYKNILVYNISCKSLIDAKPLCVRFEKKDGFIRVYDGARYLVLFGSEKYDFIYNMIRYHMEGRSSIKYAISHGYAKIKVDSFYSLPLEMTFHGFIITY